MTVACCRVGGTECGSVCTEPFDGIDPRSVLGQILELEGLGHIIAPLTHSTEHHPAIDDDRVRHDVLQPGRLTLVAPDAPLGRWVLVVGIASRFVAVNLMRGGDAFRNEAVIIPFAI